MFSSSYYLIFMDNKKYQILNTLRGLSALFVIFYHFFIFFFLHPEMSARLIDADILDAEIPFYLPVLTDIPLDIGHLGVTFFFLISGFLILPSLERYQSLKTFLVHKVFRLWPTYVVCLLLGIGFVAVFHYWRDTEFPYSFSHVFACLFWVRDIFHYPYIDGVVWTLEVQLKFYLFMAILWYFSQKNFLEKGCALIVGLSLLVYGLYAFWGDEYPSWFYLVLLARKTLKYWTLIFLGTCLYSAYKKQVSRLKAFFLCVLLLGTFVSPLFYLSNTPLTVSYLLGFFIFTFLIFFSPSFSRPPLKATAPLKKTLNWVSGISYPLYIGHVLPGYTLMFMALEEGLSVFIGLFVGLLYVFLMAFLVHQKIEIPFIKLNKKWREESSHLPPP